MADRRTSTLVLIKSLRTFANCSGLGSALMARMVSKEIEMFIVQPLYVMEGESNPWYLVVFEAAQPQQLYAHSATKPIAIPTQSIITSRTQPFRLGTYVCPISVPTPC